MPNSKSNHSDQRRMDSIKEKGCSHGGRGRVRPVTGKASSFHGRNIAEGAAVEARLLRPKMVNDLRRGTGERQEGTDKMPRLPMKLLLNVTIQGSLGPVHVVMRPESTVGDLIAMSVAQYIKEGRRPVPPTKDPVAFDLHYSQFSLESLNREEKLMNLGSRNFFLCKRRNTDDADTVCLPESCINGLALSCSEEAEKPEKDGFKWLQFMDFLLWSEAIRVISVS